MFGSSNTAVKEAADTIKYARNPIVSRAQRPAPKEPVRFFASGVSNFVFESADEELIPLNDGTYRPVKRGALEVQFHPHGESLPYDPDDPEDAKLIERARAHIEGVARGEIIDDRVERFKFRELVSGAPAPPTNTWDEPHDTDKLVGGAQLLGLNLETCIAYEQSKGSDARYDLIEALEEALTGPSEDDPFGSVEV